MPNRRRQVRIAALLGVVLLLLGSCGPAAPALEQAAAATNAPQPTDSPTPTAVALTVPPVTAVPTEPPTPEPTPEPTPAPTPTPEPTPEGLCHGKFADRFTEEPVLTDTSYQSKDLSIFLSKVYDDTSFSSFVTYFVADIYVQDITLLRTAAAGPGFTSPLVAAVQQIARNNNALFAASGDYYAHSMQGLIIRNGVSYRDRPSTRFESCVLFRDGTMEFYAPEELDADALAAAGAWQGWTFGPSLLDEAGQPIAQMPAVYSAVNERNPRCMLGYYEPGHYCLVVADGRQPSRRYSNGLTLPELSQLAYDLGCAKAYNLDGGQSAQIYWQGSIFNHPTGGGRNISDILYFAAPEEPVV